MLSRLIRGCVHVSVLTHSLSVRASVCFLHSPPSPSSPPLSFSSRMSFFYWLGVATFLFVVGYIVRVLYETFIYKCDLTQFAPKTGKGWAVVTGCTSGIGEGFAIELASRGWNLVLVSRSLDKLTALSTQLRSRSPSIQTILAVSDATNPSPSEIQSVVAALATLPQGDKFKILINNVGVSTEAPVLFGEETMQEIEAMIAVNCRYSTLLTRALLPLLQASKERCAIVNLSSQSAFVHVPYLAVYSSSKSFNLAFSHALRDELAASNIEVLALTPGFVVSAMTRIPKASLEACDAIVCARAGLNAIGLRDHCGYWWHHLSIQWSMLVPAFLRGRVALSMMAKAAAKRRKQMAAEKEKEKAGAGKKKE